MRRRRWTACAAIGLTTVALSACSASTDRIDVPSAAEGTRAIAVDTDMGLDDVLALLFLASREDITIRAVTVVGDGLVHCAAGVRNARALLAATGHADVPVACGARRPIDGTNTFPPGWRATADALYGVHLHPAMGSAPRVTAPALLSRVMDGSTTLLTLGPLTNVANALARDPGLAERIPAVVSMAGAVDVPGNAPGGMAEYNVWIDPSAARRVFTRTSATLVPLDTTNAVPVTTFFVHALHRARASAAAGIADQLVANDPYLVSGQYFFWDPLAAAIAVDPSLADIRERRLYVTTSRDATGGWISASPLGTPVALATNPDALGFERTFLSAITGHPVTRVRPSPDMIVTFSGDRCRMRAASSMDDPDLVVRFRNRSRLPAEAWLAGFAPPTTYGALLRAIGPPGSLVRQAPAGFHLLGTIQAAAGSDGWSSISPHLPDLTVACGFVVGAAFRAWPGGWLRSSG